MPTQKINRRGQEEKSYRRTRLKDKSSSFHGRSPILTIASQLPRPKTVPELASSRIALDPASTVSFSIDGPPKLTKLLLNVTIQGSLGAVQVLISPELTVGDLIVAAVRQYAKECRRPILPSVNPTRIDLHYSQFSLESLDRAVKLMELGSRNFFLCWKKSETAKEGGVTVTTSCSKEAGKASKDFAWLRFMDFML